MYPIKNYLDQCSKPGIDETSRLWLVSLKGSAKVKTHIRLIQIKVLLSQLTAVIYHWLFLASEGTSFNFQFT